MLNRIGGHPVVIVTVALVVSLSLFEVGAQTRKKKRSRRARRPVAGKPVITNPQIAPPTTAENASGSEVKIISTADQGTPDTEQGLEGVQPKPPKPTVPSDQEEMQRTIKSLSNQVHLLNDRLSRMQEDDRYLMEMERLTRAEQRAEQLRSQLIDVQSKTADLQARLDQVEYMLRPENVEKSTQGYGTVHPEEIRESRKRQLESERSRIQAQLDILEKSQVRLESAITTADSEVDLLKARLDQRRDQQSSEAPTGDRPVPPRKP